MKQQRQRVGYNYSKCLTEELKRMGTIIQPAEVKVLRKSESVFVLITELSDQSINGVYERMMSNKSS